MNVISIFKSFLLDYLLTSSAFVVSDSLKKAAKMSNCAASLDG